MRAQEIVREAVQYPASVVATSSKGDWIETSRLGVQKIWKEKTRASIGKHELPGAVRFFYQINNQDPGRVAILGMDADKNLHTVGNTVAFHMSQDVSELTPLVKAIGAQYSTGIFGPYVLWRGQLYKIKQFLSSLPEMDKLGDYPVVEVPADAHWILARQNVKFDPNADQILAIHRSSIVEDWIIVSIQNNTVKNIDYQKYFIPNKERIKLPQELAKKFGFKLDKTHKFDISPQSQDHKLLQAVADLPQHPRVEIYQHAGYAQAPAVEGPQDLLGQLLELGLVEKTKAGDSPALYSLTAAGSLVLGAVNKGVKISKAELLSL